MRAATNHIARGSDAEVVAARLRGALSEGAVVRQNEPMARRTTLRVGGPADLYVEPASEADLSATLAACADSDVPVFLLGRGSNVLVNDGGIRGAVVCLCQPFFCQVEVLGERLKAGAGAKLKALAVKARSCSLAGLEFLEGIPGSVGGALRMNAGAMGSAIFERVESVRTMSGRGTVCEQPASALEVGYRSCPSLKGQVVLSATFRARPGVAAEIEQRMSEYSRKRWASQPAAPSAGCIFKNPPAVPAGKLIDELGLKGTSVGAARVSAEHGNFIVNDGGATAADILALVDLIRKRALEVRGIQLELEVQVI